MSSDLAPAVVPTRDVGDASNLQAPIAGPATSDAPAPPLSLEQKIQQYPWPSPPPGYQGMKKKKKRKLVPRDPKDSKVRKAALAYVALRAQGVSVPEIAEMTGYSIHTLKTYVKRAHKKGWINSRQIEDPEDRLDMLLRDTAITNLEEALNDTTRNEKTGIQVKTHVALEVAKGTGLLKNHTAQKVETAVNTGFALSVKVDMPPGQVPQLAPGSVGEAPAVVNGEIVKDDSKDSNSDGH